MCLISRMPGFGRRKSATQQSESVHLISRMPGFGRRKSVTQQFEAVHLISLIPQIPGLDPFCFGCVLVVYFLRSPSRVPYRTELLPVRQKGG